MWSNTNDLLKAIHTAHGSLRSGKTDADTAHAEARLLGTAVKTLDIALEHAKLTGRLKTGSAVLPEMVIGK